MNLDSSQREAWHITLRWQSFEGEIRAGILRVAALIFFYLLQLVHYLFFSDGTETEQLFHRQITWVVATWLFVTLATLACLRRRVFPSWLGTASCIVDLVLLTLGAILGSAANSPLVHCYFLVIGISALRSNLTVIWLSTLGSMLCYMVLVGASDKSWFNEEHAVEPIRQLVTLVALAGMGLALGQLVRMNRKSAAAYLERIRHLQQLDMRPEDAEGDGA